MSKTGWGGLTTVFSSVEVAHAFKESCKLIHLLHGVNVDLTLYLENGVPMRLLSFLHSC